MATQVPTTDDVKQGAPCSVSHFGLGSVAPADTQAANPDTSGAALAALETEVNEIKAVLRTFGFIAP